MIALTAKADIHIINNNQETALLHSLNSKNKQLVAILLESWADLFPKNILEKIIFSANPSIIEVVCNHVYTLDKLESVFDCIKKPHVVSGLATIWRKGLAVFT